jgi:pimeloyl-ACP methyl ester carboxylesterase
MYADLSDVRCYYELLGSGDPVMLVSGLGATHELWDCVANELSQSFSLVLHDNRGIGRSVHKRTPQALADFAVDIVELMDHLQLERAHVIGLSLGGIIAQQLAVDHPSRVDRLVLVSCANRFGPYLREVARLLGQALRHFPPEVYRRTMELMGTAPKFFDDHEGEIESKIKETVAQGISRRAIGRQLRCLAHSDVIRDEKDYRIETPTLVIAGDRDMLIPACYARKMAEAIPGSEFLLVRECGHNPFVERPDVVVPRVVEFLTRSRSGARSAGAGKHGAQLVMEEIV